MNLLILALALTLLVNVDAHTPATYTQLQQDVVVSGKQNIVVITINLNDWTNVFVASDGRFFPDGKSVGLVQITVDGNTVSTQQVIDWEHSLLPAQHAYSLVGVTKLSPGSHTVALYAATINGVSFSMGAGSNLGALPLESGVSVASSYLSSDIGPLSFSVPPGTSVLPHKPVISVSIPAVPSAPGQYGQVVAFASGRSFADGIDGDPFWLLYINGNDIVWNNQTLHSDNDLWTYAEAGNAPMMTYGFFDHLTEWAQTTISLDASAEPWSFCCNTVKYKIGAGSGLVALSGLSIMERAVLSSAINTPLEYICVASSSGWSGCPPAGAPYSFAQQRFTIPSGHGGDVYIMAKALVQADENDKGGIVFYQIRLDGNLVGSVGVQELKTGDTVSTRTISASHLATGLSAGSHLAEVIVTAQGSFIHLAFTRDLPLVVFG